MRLNYHVSSIVWLSLEDYTNAGMTLEQTKKIIESCGPLCGDYALSCERSGLNENWNVRTKFLHPDDLSHLVMVIKGKLTCELKEMRQYKLLCSSDPSSSPR